MNVNGKKVIVAGHICLDITPVFPKETSGEIGTVVLPGKLVNMEGVDVHTGGSVANTGLGMKILGADVQLMGKIGKDEFGNIISEITKSYGITEKMIETEKTNTSYSIVMALPGQDRSFLHSTGANDTFSYDDLNMKKIKEASLFHFGYPPLMRRMYEQDGQELVKIFKKVSEIGLITSMDMAAIDPNSKAGLTDWKKVLEKVLPFVDIFVPSVEELLYMLEPEKLEQISKEAKGKDITYCIDWEKDVKTLGEQLIKMGAKIVLIKCGAPGLYYKTGVLETIREKSELTLNGWENREGFECSFVPEQVLSATGAGDTTIAAFLTALIKDIPFDTAISYASATGALCVGTYDALSSIKSFEDIDKKIKNGWEKQYVSKSE